ncbi:MAG: type IV pilin [Methanomassiliicoccales archaeon]|nr:type IV pilin [Methanomassiliicoccales archaeon]
MKKMWKKNNKAVSPVIATILMVAITVVLAAVLYVMVMGFGGSGSSSAPSASLTVSGDKLVISLSKAYAPSEGVLAVILGTNTTKVTIGSLASGSFTPAGSLVSLVDAGLDEKIDTGDYFTNTASTAMQIQLVWTSGDTSQVIATGSI